MKVIAKIKPLASIFVEIVKQRAEAGQ